VSFNWLLFLWLRSSKGFNFWKEVKWGFEELCRLDLYVGDVAGVAQEFGHLLALQQRVGAEILLLRAENIYVFRDVQVRVVYLPTIFHRVV
jgi:hypothetical protein